MNQHATNQRKGTIPMVTLSIRLFLLLLVSCHSCNFDKHNYPIHWYFKQYLPMSFRVLLPTTILELCFPSLLSQLLNIVLFSYWTISMYMDGILLSICAQIMGLFSILYPKTIPSPLMPILFLQQYCASNDKRILQTKARLTYTMLLSMIEWTT